MKALLFRLLTLLTLLCTWNTGAAAELTAADFWMPRDTSVWFVTIGPGREVYELEGHSAIAVVYPDGRGLAYNYGVYDFNAPNFIWRFTKGETDYMAVEYPLRPFLLSYVNSGRHIEATRLELDSLAHRRLLARLSRDVSPEHRVYRYNYVLDNCATRPLRAVELAYGDSLILPPGPHERSGAPMTFRSVMRRYHRNYPWYQFGIDLALGSGIDRPITTREAAFAPAELSPMLAATPVAGGTVTLLEEHNPTAGPTPWYLTPDSAGWALFVLAALVCVRDVRRQRLTRWFQSAFFGLLGLGGCLLTFLIFVSVHEATSPNWQYAWLNPFCLIGAVAIWIKSAKNVLICYHFINFVAVIAFAVAWPWIPQSGNTAFVPLVAADILCSATALYVLRKKWNSNTTYLRPRS